MIAIGFLIAVVNIYMIVLLVRVISSWLPPRARANQLYEFLYAITEPAMRPLRRLIPPISGFDLSPIVLFFVLTLIERFLRRAQLGW